MLQSSPPNAAEKLRSQLFELEFVKRGVDSSPAMSWNVLSCLLASKIMRKCTQMDRKGMKPQLIKSATK